MIKRSRVRILAGAAEQFSSSPGSASTSVLSLISVYVLPQCYRSNTKKLKNCPGHSTKSAGGSLQLIKQTPYVCGFA